ncbi:MAG: trypsin-like peptidase domain-containing protein [Acidobacteria bacterium]|nr:trypsin-like peptidase domain-containing protein [Acidobacteriota bacterium]
MILLSLLLIINLHAEEHAKPKVRTPPTNLSGEEARTVKLYQKVLPTVVTIFSTKQVVSLKGRIKVESLGSGVLIPPDTHVLTAAHLVDGTDEIMVKTQDGKMRPAQIVFSESGADIALLRLETPDPSLEHAKLGDSDRLAVGQTAYVVGSPFGQENSFSVGHISGFREFNRLYDGTILAEFIQVDAAINSGNSGGPVFNSRAEVIGIASQILTQSGGFEGLGFVVAINAAKQLLALEDRIWLGIEGIFLDGEKLSRLLNLDMEGGLLIQYVTKGSPADKAGLRGGTIPAQIFDQEILLGGDLIIEFNNQEACHSECPIQERDRIAKLDQISVKILRGGKILEKTVDVSQSRRNYLKTRDIQ